MEEWKPLRETDQYEVSTEGRIRNVRTGRILTGTIDGQGRVQVCLTIDGKVGTKVVHRLVAEAYFGDECNGKDVYHRDRDKTNNRVDNLVVGTRSDVIKYAYRHGDMTPNNQRPVRCVETGEVFESVSECARQMHISKQSVSRSANNPVSHTKDGLHFEHID